MANFYNKYKNIFLKDEPIFNNYSSFIDKSYLKNYQRDFNNQSYISNTNKLSKSLIKQNKPDRFQTQIIPQINRLNRQSNKLRIHTEQHSTNTPVYNYTPIIKNKKRVDISFPSITKKQNPEEQFRKTIRKESAFRDAKSNFTRKPLKISNNKQQSLNSYQPINNNIQYYPPKHHRDNPSQKQSTHQQQDFNEEYLPHKTLKKTKNNYLQFSEYVNQNQYQFVNKRLNDLKRCKQYHPRGYINSYRDALLRRVQAKNNIHIRQQQLKAYFREESMLYEKHLPLI